MIEWLVRNCKDSIGQEIGLTPFDKFNRNVNDENQYNTKQGQHFDKAAESIVTRFLIKLETNLRDILLRWHVHHFLDWVELRIVQVFVEQISNQPRSQDFFHKEEESIKVEHKEHSNQPVKAQTGAGR